MASAVVVRTRLWRRGGRRRRGAWPPPGWWRRPPFLPVPDAAYWRFRMQTAYGDETAGSAQPRRRRRLPAVVSADPTEAAGSLLG